MKNLKKEIITLVIIIIVTTIISLWYKLYYNWKVFEAKQKLLIEELEKNRISESEKLILEYKKKTDENKRDIEKMNKQIEALDKNLSEKEFMNECIKLQIDRAFEWKSIENWYCDKKTDEKIDKTPKILPVSDSIIKKDIMYSKDNFNIEKSMLFMCKEVNEKFWLKADEKRCATMMTMVKFLETENWDKWIWKSLNNMYWIKNPTDKNWLVWSWKVWEWKHIIFETKEMSSYAFAYYYMKYHNYRDLNNFVDRWVSWNNQKYKTALKNNYDWIYEKYKNI